MAGMPRSPPHREVSEAIPHRTIQGRLLPTQSLSCAFQNVAVPAPLAALRSLPKLALSARSSSHFGLIDTF